MPGLYFSPFHSSGIYREPHVIELSGASKQYGSLFAVDDVSFSVEAGEYFALLGPNGAGKTTIVRMLLGFTRPTSGRLSINGLPTTDAACRKGVGYVAENVRILPSLSGWQYLKRNAELLGMTPPDAQSECGRIVTLIGMNGKEHTRAGTYSKGMLQRFGLGAALLGRPGLLMLDEPVSGLDPIGIREVRMLLESLKKEGTTVFLNSHLLSEVEKICDTVGIIDRGRLLAKDRITSIVKDGETLEDMFVRLVRG
jgi:ABC-2 type transport system ATP-binding protein